MALALARGALSRASRARAAPRALPRAATLARSYHPAPAPAARAGRPQPMRLRRWALGCSPVGPAVAALPPGKPAAQWDLQGLRQETSRQTYRAEKRLFKTAAAARAANEKVCEGSACLPAHASPPRGAAQRAARRRGCAR